MKNRSPKSTEPIPRPTKLKALGSAIRIARKKRRLSLDAVAAQVGKSAATLSRVEAGLLPLEVGTFLALADIIGFSAGAVLTNVQREADGNHDMWTKLAKIAG